MVHQHRLNKVLHQEVQIGAEWHSNACSVQTGIRDYANAQQVQYGILYTQKAPNHIIPKGNVNDLSEVGTDIIITRICAAEMAVRYAALSACRKVHP